MKMIVLAAGEGTRLRPYTLDKPKCMVEFNKKPMIDHLLDNCKALGLTNVIIVTGYKEDVLKAHLSNQNLTYCSNSNYNVSNMVSSLFCAQNEMTEDIIISYSDIIYKKSVLEELIQSKSDFSVVVDKNWKDLWSIRMEDPLSDAETLKINSEGNIEELGKKPRSYSEIEGQYIGLLKIKKNALAKFINYYHSLDKTAIYDGKTFDNMFMTTLIQSIITNVMPVKPVFIKGGWLEIDSVEDLKNYEKAAMAI